MKLVILGAGAIGAGIGGLLTQHHPQVELIARGEHLRIMQEEGLTLSTPSSTQTFPVIAKAHPNEVQWSSGDIVLVSTKLYDAQQAIKDLHEAAGDKITILCMFNGLDAGERMATALFSKVWSAMMYMPATFLKPGHIELYGQACPGILNLGTYPATEPPQKMHALAEHMRQAGLDVQTVPDIMPSRRAKLLTNLAGIAQALTQVDPELDWKALAKQARAEAKTVYKSLGWDGDALLGDLLGTRCKGFKVGLINGQARAGSSTWQSAHRGRPTEAQWLNGAITTLGKKAGVPTPINDDLLARANAHWPS